MCVKNNSSNNKGEHKFNSKVVKKAEKKLQDRIKELSAIYKTSKSIIASVDINEILDLIVKSIFDIVNPNGCVVYLYKPSLNKFIFKTGKSVEEDFSFKNLKISENDIFAQKKVLNTQEIQTVNDASNLNEAQKRTLADYKIKSFVSIPLLRDSQIIGLFVVFSSHVVFFNKEKLRILQMFSKQAAIAIQNTKLLEKTQLSYLNTVKTLANIIEVKDFSTYGHSSSVMSRTLAIAEEMGLSEKEKKTLRFASFLHDIGKIDIDVSILRKPESLTEEEWKAIKKHPKIGSEIVKGIESLKDLAPIILNHHARYSGGGYPNSKLKGEDIPLGARILTVADAYESMITDRPYRKALSKEQAIKEMKAHSKTQFDPKIVKVLLKTLKK